MNDLPAPTAEGRLIRQARELAVPRLSIRAAAARISMSPEQWGNIERGYRYTRPNDPPRPFKHPPATTIAKMASAVGISPDQLESEGQRPDAAEILREIISQQGDSRTAPPEPGPVRDFARVEDEQALRPFIENVLRELYASVGLTFGPGQRVPELAEVPAMEKVLTAKPGKEIFAAEWEALMWNSGNVTPEERYRTIGILRQMLAEGTEAGVQRNRSA